jgi:hypothetical protein
MVSKVANCYRRLLLLEKCQGNRAAQGILQLLLTLLSGKRTRESQHLLSPERG